VFDAWFDALWDRQAKVRIEMRLLRLTMGNEGDCRNLQGGIFGSRPTRARGLKLWLPTRSGAVRVVV